MKEVNRYLDSNMMARIEQLKVMGEMAREIIHDFNNMITTISGLAQMTLLMDISPKVKENLNLINITSLDCKIAMEKLNNYISGKYDLSKDYLYMDEIIEYILKAINHRFISVRTSGKSNLGLEIQLNSNGLIYANEYEMKQLIFNILSNGIDAMEELGGILTIRSYDEEKYIVVEISDTGMGIGEKEQEKIFEPYYTTKGKGTGLGLKMVKDILNSHRGTIELDSILGEGTLFRIKIPRAQHSGIEDKDKDNYNKE